MSTTLTAHVALVSDTDSIQLDDLSPVAAALQKQVTRDFGPLWNVNATVDAFDSLESVPVDYWPVILRDDINQPGAAGFHTDDHGQPFSLVQADGNWPLTTSHEVLEMLGDPFGSRTVAGSPPPHAPAPVSKLKRVTYLVEVCDPCESDQFSYPVNGIQVSDFITPHYYDPRKSSGVRYSFVGSIEAPHTVLEGGYVSFGNPVDHHWYQIIVQNGKQAVRDLGIISSTNGKSLRELVDRKVREVRAKERYRLKPAAAAAAAFTETPFSETTTARATWLRDYVKGLK
ncbi:MAG TPA: hypothetical protein VKE71_08470 [Candidatus Angelobacter sp.]|nr:hypothetical protein [Candidatus Angelobacter sp.]